MLKKSIRTNAILDKLHRGVVWTCIGVTLAGTCLLGYRAYRYFTVVKPARREMELQMIQEGSQDSAEELKY